MTPLSRSASSPLCYAGGTPPVAGTGPATAVAGIAGSAAVGLLVLTMLAMQTAERNISDRLAELNTVYRQQRQEAITAELLDVVAGFEALTGSQSAQDQSRCPRRSPA